MQKTKSAIGVINSVFGWIYLLLIVGLLPFYYTQGYGYIGSDKASFFKSLGFPVLWAGLAGLLLYAVLDVLTFYKGKTKKEMWEWLKGKFSLTDLFVLGYAIVLIVSYLSTDFKEIAWYGHEKWPNGLLPHMMVVISYFLLSRFFVGRGYLLGLLRVVSAIVFLLAVLDRLELRPLDMEYAGYWFISTIGNLNWFCGYWSVVAWVSIISYWNQEVRNDHRNRVAVVFDGVLSALAMLTCLIQGSDSGAMAMAVVFVVMFCISVESGDRMQRLFELLIYVCIACLLGYVADSLWAKEAIYQSWIIDLVLRSKLPWLGAIVCAAVWVFLWKINKTNQFPKKPARIVKKWLIRVIAAGLGIYVVLLALNSLLPNGLGPLHGKGAFTFDKMWAAQRGGTWKVAFLAWWDQDLWHKLIGVGPDGMWSYITGGANPSLYELVNEQFPNMRLLNAHGEWVTILLNLGILGVVAFAGFQISFIRRCIQKAKEKPVFYLFGLLTLSYIVNNIFSFQTTMNLTHIFLMMGVGESLLRRKEEKGRKR